MKKVNIILRTQEVLFVVWDGEDDTLDVIKEKMLPKVNASFEVKKLHDEEDGYILVISETCESGLSNYYNRVGDYIVLDYSPVDKYGIPLSKDEIIYSLKGYESEVFHEYYVL